ncbi:hypothetical protein ABC382_00540 [Lysinibacillus sp. 1P01SD]|uniref:hypothetical protein n=1 Tax=Lysinibacillus sp. 1P01SD TaxID=3132285 RepID=UPI0039A2F0AB
MKSYFEAIVFHGVEDNDHLVVKASSINVARKVVSSCLGVNDTEVIVNPLSRDIALFEFGRVYRSKQSKNVNVQALLKYFNRDKDEVLILNKGVQCVEHALSKLI